MQRLYWLAVFDRGQRPIQGSSGYGQSKTCRAPEVRDKNAGPLLNQRIAELGSSLTLAYKIHSATLGPIG
jgi:hypothetical protein